MTTPTGAAEAPAEPLKCKRWVLKVSIHCEGCKRKVKKVLHSVEGVYTVDIEAKQHRVTVHGDVEADALIKKLIKSGKQASLWPGQPDQREKKSGKAKSKEKQSDAADDAVEGGGGGADKEKQPSVKLVQGPSESSAAVCLAKNGEGGGVSVKNSEGGGAAKFAEPDRKTGGGAVKFNEPDRKTGGGAVKFTEPDRTNGSGQTKTSKSEGNKPENSSAAEKKDGECNDDGGAEKNGGKKKKKEAPGGSEGEASYGAPGSPRPTSRGYGPPQADQSPPRHYGYHHPSHYYVPPPPVCAVSYSASHPTPSYTMSYPGAPPPSSYAYSYPPFETEPPPSVWESHPQQPLDSFGFLSDENPNACTIV